MSAMKNLSSVYGKVASISRSRNGSVVYVAGVSFSILAPWLIFRRKRGRYPKALVLYRAHEGYPQSDVVAVFVSPSLLTWRTIQEAARTDTATVEFLQSFKPDLISRPF